MHRYFVIFVCLFIGSASNAAEFSVRSEVTKAEIASDGGIITRTAAIDLPAGSHELRIAGLSQDEYIFDIELPDGVKLLASEVLAEGFVRPLREKTDAERAQETVVDQARAALHAHQDKISAQKALLESAELRLELMSSMATGNAGILTLEQVSDPLILSQLSTQLGAETQTAFAERDAAQRALLNLDRINDELLDAYDQAKDQLKILAPRERDEVLLVVKVFAEKPVRGEFAITLAVEAVYWSAFNSYYLTQDELKGSLIIERKAVVRQRTGEDWNNVQLSLTTSSYDGRIQSYVPHSKIKHLFDPEEYRRKELGTRKLSSVSADSASRAPQIEAFAEGVVAPSRNTVSARGQVLNFEIGAPVNVKSGSESVEVALDVLKSELDLYARVTPDREEKAILYADFKNETAGRLLAARGPLYRDGAFYGFMDTPEIVAGDTYEIGFGIIEGLLIDRVVLKREDGDRGLLSGTQIAERRYHTTIESLLSYDIGLELFDVLPISEAEDLEITEVSRPNPTGRDFDGRRGVLKWDIDVKSGSKQSVDFGYDMRWPSGQGVGDGPQR